jgi:hypothetical protein
MWVRELDVTSVSGSIRGGGGTTVNVGVAVGGGAVTDNMQVAIAGR